MKKFITLFSIALGVSFAAMAQFPTTLVLTEGSATVDGFIDANDPWGDTWVSQDSIKGTTTDMTSHFQMANDDAKIYVVVEVTDGTESYDATAIPNSYERDCMEIFFSMKSTGFDVKEYGAGDHQIRCLRGSDTDEFIDGSTDVAALLEAGSIEYAVEADGDGYVIEMAFDITAIAGESDFDGSNFRFDLATADNTTGAEGGRTQQSFYGSTSDNQWQYTDLHSPAVLAGGVTTVANTAAATISAYVSGNDVVVSNVTGLVSIYNVAGQLMTSQVVDGNGTINVSNLNSGLYIVKNNDYSVKIMK